MIASLPRKKTPINTRITGLQIRTSICYPFILKFGRCQNLGILQCTIRVFEKIHNIIWIRRVIFEYNVGCIEADIASNFCSMTQPLQDYICALLHRSKPKHFARSDTRWASSMANVGQTFPTLNRFTQMLTDRLPKFANVLQFDTICLYVDVFIFWYFLYVDLLKNYSFSKNSIVLWSHFLQIVFQRAALGCIVALWRLEDQDADELGGAERLNYEASYPVRGSMHCHHFFFW